VTGDLERRQPFEQTAAVLYERYAGFTGVEALSDHEKILALVSLIPMALQVVDEARDTIERLNSENAALRGSPPAPPGADARSA
jgi:PII-like signaling protein